MSMDFTIARRMDDGSWWHGHHDAAFNVHNQGGAAILRTIGIEADSCGSHDAADVVARCVTWRAVDAPARGIAERAQGVGAGGAQWYEGGVSFEYVEARIAQLEALARIAVAEGTEVGWS